MSILLEALERCLRVLEYKHSHIIQDLKPGLSIEEIENITNSLLYKIPKEIKELYQWRNGMNFGGIFYSPYSNTLLFNSLDKAVEKSFQLTGLEKYKVEEDNQIEELHLFNSIDRWYPFAAWQELDKTAIFTITDDSYLRIPYTSLTNMVLAHAECYENELFTFRCSGYVGREVHLEEGDDTKREFLSVVNKYNLLEDKNYIFNQYNIDIENRVL